MKPTCPPRGILDATYCLEGDGAPLQPKRSKREDAGFINKFQPSHSSHDKPPAPASKSKSKTSDDPSLLTVRGNNAKGCPETAFDEIVTTLMSDPRARRELQQAIRASRGREFQQSIYLRI